ncbi:hypothetical protein J6590_099190 [Homalodisca vitripennis]|nr:hypothetical protein J6590_099190 [Homalodisca vitripennis]
MFQLMYEGEGGVLAASERTCLYPGPGLQLVQEGCVDATGNVSPLHPQSTHELNCFVDVVERVSNIHNFECTVEFVSNVQTVTELQSTAFDSAPPLVLLSVKHSSPEIARQSDVN